MRNPGLARTCTPSAGARINFDGAKIPESLVGGEIYNVGGGTIILKKVKLPEKVSDRQVFVEVVQYSDGDAYDRTGSIFMIPTDKKQSFIDAIRDLKSVPAFHSGDTDYHGLVSTPEYDVPLELMRFFTGARAGTETRPYNFIRSPVIFFVIRLQFGFGDVGGKRADGGDGLTACDVAVGDALPKLAIVH